MATFFVWCSRGIWGLRCQHIIWYLGELNRPLEMGIMLQASHGSQEIYCVSYLLNLLCNIGDKEDEGSFFLLLLTDFMEKISSENNKVQNHRSAEKIFLVINLVLFRSLCLAFSLILSSFSWKCFAYSHMFVCLSSVSINRSDLKHYKTVVNSDFSAMSLYLHAIQFISDGNVISSWI